MQCSFLLFFISLPLFEGEDPLVPVCEPEQVAQFVKSKERERERETHPRSRDKIGTFREEEEEEIVFGKVEGG